MVTTSATNPRARGSLAGTRGLMMMDLIVAMAILAMAMIPLGFSFFHEGKLCRAYYYRAIAMEIIDGETEILAAGEWHAFRQGSHPYIVRAESAKNLPPGHFVLTVDQYRLRLEWLPDKPGKGGGVFREVTIQ